MTTPQWIVSDSFKRWILPLLFFFGLLVAWEFCAITFRELLFILPAPTEVLHGMIENSDRFVFHLMVTLREVFWGCTLALFIAAPTAWLMAEYKTTKLMIQPLFVISQSIPIFAIAPIMVLWFDWGELAIIVPTALMVFFPLALTLYQGLIATPREWIEFFRLHQASRWKIFTKLSVPYALPHLFAGLKISAAIAAIGAVSAEWTGAQAGLGMLILESRRNVDLNTTFGAIVCVVMVGLSLYLSVLVIEQLVIRQKKRRKGAPVRVTLAILLVLCLVGCQKSQDSEYSTQKVRLLLDWFPNPNHVALYAGVKKGIFSKYGIDLHLQKIFDPVDTLPFLTSNQTDLAIYYMPQILKAVSKGADLKVVGRLIPIPLNCLLFLKTSNISSIADLSGKVIGHSMSTFDAVYFRQLCEQQKVCPKKSIHLSTDLIPAITTRQVDVILGACWNIEPEQLEALGIKTGYIRFDELGFPSYEELVIMANPSIAKNTELVSRFQKALQESIEFSKANAKEAFTLYIDANPDKMLQTKIWEERAWEKTRPLLAKDQHFDMDKWEQFSQWMQQQKIVTAPVDVSKILP